MTGGEVLAAASWNTNADLLADAVVPLGYLDPAADRVLDCTWGLGVWHNRFTVADLVACDIDPTKSPYGCSICERDADHPKVKNRPMHDGLPVDYRALPFADCTFDVVMFDPAYVLQGGRATSSIPDYNERYGRHLTPSSPAALREDIAAGLAESHRVLRRGGRALVKCANYVWSGRLVPGVAWTFEDAAAVGFEMVDWFTHVGSVRAQPKNRTRKCGACRGSGLCDWCGGSGRVASVQRHARQNSSALFVLRRTAAPPPQGSLFSPCGETVDREC
mgnify:FL=1